MKKIALVGNMNNNFYALTHYLRDKGYDAHLFYRLAMDHFQPKADCYDDSYMIYCHEVDWLKYGFHNVDKKRVKEQLEGFDFYIGQGEEAAVAYYCGYKMNVYYPYGSDIYKYAYLPYEYSIASKIRSLISKNANRPTYKQMKIGTMAKYLKGVIESANNIFAEATNEEYKSLIDKLNYKGRYRNIAMPFIYTPEYDKLNNGFVPDFTLSCKVKEIRQGHDFVLLYHGRQEWKTYHNKFTGKNTDFLIKGFAKYVKANPAKKSCIIMIEYGSDVDVSKQLIEELGIATHVFWFPKMYRKELMYLIKTADVCCGEFAHSYLTFGTVVEAMLMKKPVITYREDAYYLKTYPKLYPCFNAREPDEIAKAINIAATEPGKTKKMGEEAHAWVMQHFIVNPLQQLQDVIEQ